MNAVGVAFDVTKPNLNALNARRKALSARDREFAFDSVTDNPLAADAKPHKPLC